MASKMEKYRIVATSTFGLESIVAEELKDLGYGDLRSENGRITFEGEARDIAKCNINLRTADRILIQLAQFPANDFDQLFSGTKNINWGDIIPERGKIHVVGKSVRSKLHGVPTCQAMVKKAIVEVMKRKYRTEWFKEDGPEYKIEISINKDEATLSLDTSGYGLHRRGYRAEGGEAPLRENLAAAMVILSKWDPSRVLADPLCGSGTIVIEAAMIGRNIAPGLNRSFVSENWHQIPAKLWVDERTQARQNINREQFRILGSDIDGRILTVARDNAFKAAVSDNVAFQTLPVSEFKSRKKYGCIISNPPYGERIGEMLEVENLYKMMGETFSQLDSWSYFILSGHENFEKFFGSRSTKNRKLYNGNLRCYLYQYFGPLPENN
jgi:putative N6-adenine-specific DNA methylase